MPYTFDEGLIVTAEAQAAAVLARARTAAEVTICEAIDAAGAAVSGRYPQVERETWPQQEAAARSWLADAEAISGPDLAFLEAIAGARGLSIATLAPVIVAKADLFREVGGALAGARGAAFEAFAAASSAEGVTAALATAIATIGAHLAELEAP